MATDYVLPLNDFTVEDLVVLPDDYRYELIEGRLDLQQRAPLSQLAGLAILSTLRASCPYEFRVLPRIRLRPRADDLPAPDVVVVDSDGQVVLVVDVMRPDWSFVAMLDRMKGYADAGVPRCWVFESKEFRGATMAVFRSGADGRWEEEMRTGGVFSVDVPFPVVIDLPALSVRWPETFEYNRTLEEWSDDQ